MSSCTNCGADWSNGEFNRDCPQCGGGAMELPCPRCGGRCGSVWMRAVQDSQDSNDAHWIGGCGLPFDEQAAILKDADDK